MIDYHYFSFNNLSSSKEIRMWFSPFLCLLFFLWAHSSIWFHFPSALWSSFNFSYRAGLMAIGSLSSFLKRILYFLFDFENISFLFFWPCHMSCGILVPWAGIELWPQQRQCWSLIPGPPGIPNRDVSQ